MNYSTRIKTSKDNTDEKKIVSQSNADYEINVDLAPTNRNEEKSMKNFENLLKFVQ